MKHIKYIFFAWIVIITNHVFSQQLRFKQITNEEGLSTNYVSAIIQDDKGFMWFGTQDGLNKYDGYNITIFKNDPTTQNSLSSSEITCLKQIKQDLIAVGTRDGINFFNPIFQMNFFLSNFFYIFYKEIIKNNNRNVED